MGGQEKPDVALARFALVAFVIACVVASAVTAPLVALLRWAHLPDLVAAGCALVVWYVGFKVSQSVMGRLFERSETVRRATTPRPPRANHQSW